MPTELIAITEYCKAHELDLSFIDSLENDGLIHLIIQEDSKYIDCDSLQEVELYTRWHSEMGINTEGIDTIRHLLEKIRMMQKEIRALRSQLGIYSPGPVHSAVHDS